MITAIDTNILIDVFGADAKFGHSSEKLLKQCIQEGTLCACEVVWAEVAALFPSKNACIKAMEILGVEFSALNQESALHASESWRHYRRSGGKRERVVADFLIGAHGALQADRLLTRDRGFYRGYFKHLKIVAP